MEAILVIQKKKGAVRCVDVAEHLKVTKPSVSRAVKELAKTGHIHKKVDCVLSLTELGHQLAEQIYERHRFFTRRLIAAGVDPETAAKAAAAMIRCSGLILMGKTKSLKRR